ncbi:hypothetical protein [Candidatus Hakubella thermalkaliphila]|nr:hypothetical protein [Candidatus Hakubella thermalkaliphila]
MASSDFLSASINFGFTLYDEIVPLRTAEEDLPSSLTYCHHIPLPIHRRDYQQCCPRFFLLSVAFAQSNGARLPHTLSGIVTLRCGRIPFMVRTVDLLASLQSTLSFRFDARISPDAGNQLHGLLVVTMTGLDT